MVRKSDNATRSYFEIEGISSSVDTLKAEVRAIYLDDQIPWVIGYSGGKDSTAVLQLIWTAISELPLEKRDKPIHVISTDTLVENPVVASWVSRSLDFMREAAEVQHMPLQAHRLTPEISDSFWVNLIGRGYAAPRNKFRWCTERLKIKPSNEFIRTMVQENGEVILILGTRKAESVSRARNMERHEKKAIGDRLTPNASLSNCVVYTPIQDWSNDDVWMFLMRYPNSWGYNHKDLLSMYRGASADGECPLVVDSTTPSCGNSRFGCWVCTLVDEDKSMGAMIQNDEEKEWMLPMLQLRNELDFRSEEARRVDRSRRDFRRITGHLKYYTNKAGEPQLVPGPYKQDARSYWLRRVLQTQRWVRENGPSYVSDITLITSEELREIRRLWVVEKHEIEDILPRIYQEELGEPYPETKIDDNLVFDFEALQSLKNICAGDGLHFELSRNLLDIERQFRTMNSRRGLFQALERAIERCFYDNEEDALERAKDKQSLDQISAADMEFLSSARRSLPLFPEDTD